MRKLRFFIVIVSIAPSFIWAQNNSKDLTKIDQPPSWAKSVIWYQIFVERFNNGNPSNDPKPENVNVPFVKSFVPENWATTPWTSDWRAFAPWEAKLGKPFNEILQYRRYGGDLQGVLNKLDYLQDLGITALFINPINDANSLHKYDARNYHHIDVNFGPDPFKDKKIMADEDPSDPATWKWTTADKQFLTLIAEAHKRKMKVIIDFSWNHTGTDFWAFQDVVKNQANSKFKDFYDIESFDDPTTPANEFKYKGWFNIASLPEIKKVDITTPRKAGYPYEGNINSIAKKHIFEVAKRWLAPDGKPENGVDGYRLDVADQIGMAFWREFRTEVRRTKSDAYLVGEIWWQEWPDYFMNPVPYTNGDIFDAVMYYHQYKPARYFFANTNFSIDANQFKDSLNKELGRLRKENKYAMMNTSSTHDTPRLLTDFYNPNKYKYNASEGADSTYKIGKPNPEAYQRLKLYLINLFTNIGAPQIWNGEEMGMWGADDPDPRKPLWWKEFTFEPETNKDLETRKIVKNPVTFNSEQFALYKQLCAIRNANAVLSTGEISFLITSGKKLVYKRFDDKNEILVLFNVEEKSQKFDLPAKSSYLDLMTNKKVNTSSVVLEKLSATILKKVE